jgi:plasmid maintenance system antidote protein VapI
MHPGAYLERELRKRKIPKGQFSLNIREYPQTLVAVTKGKRRMNPSLALRAERALQLEEGFLMVLQALFDLEEEKRNHPSEVEPVITRFRATLFWDTDIFKLNWDLHKQYIIRRVMQRGTKHEQHEIVRLYGMETVKSIYPAYQP